jgi:two-component sensor histidine kinase
MIDLRSHIDSAYATLDSGDHVGPDFSSFLTSLCQLWDGLCTITMSDPQDLTPRIDDSLPTAAAATEVVREAVGNAIRHGSANTVAISLDSDDERLLSIVVTDNGTGVVEGASPGLGSDLSMHLHSAGAVRHPLTARPSGLRWPGGPRHSWRMITLFDLRLASSVCM